MEVHLEEGVVDIVITINDRIFLFFRSIFFDEHKRGDFTYSLAFSFCVLWWRCSLWGGGIIFWLDEKKYIGNSLYTAYWFYLGIVSFFVLLFLPTFFYKIEADYIEYRKSLFINYYLLPVLLAFCVALIWGGYLGIISLVVFNMATRFIWGFLQTALYRFSRKELTYFSFKRNRKYALDLKERAFKKIL